MIKYDSSDSERESESEKDSDVEMNEPPKKLKNQQTNLKRNNGLYK